MSAPREFAPGYGGVLPALLVPASEQQLRSTAGRMASDGYSWLQAVHWVVASKCYRPSWRGPKEMGLSTVRVAQELARLSPCRPGVDHLVKRLRLSERTVQNHLRMLREAGLIAYISVGTRRRGEAALASEFALVIPSQFDLALGIRTSGEGSGRRMVGIAAGSRDLMAYLGKKAARKWRARRTAKAPAKPFAKAADAGPAVPSPSPARDAGGVSGDDPRCTPMGVGTSVCLSDRPSLLPPESRLAAGKQRRHTRTEHPKAGAGRREQRVLNRVGQRYRMAFELVQQVPWLSTAAVPRIAWVVRELADAGWSTEEVLGWLETTQAPSQIRRPSAFLSARIRSAHLVVTTPEQRAALAEGRRDSKRSQTARHTEAWDQDWTPPRSQATRREVSRILTELRRGTVRADTPAYGEGDHVPVEDLTRTEVLHLRLLARDRPGLVCMAIEGLGEDYARRLYTNAVVGQLLRTRTPEFRG